MIWEVDDNQYHANAPSTTALPEGTHFNKYQQTINEIQQDTGFLNNFKFDDNSKVLHVCMASAGFSTTIRKRFPWFDIYGHTLPEEVGGFKMHRSISYDAGDQGKQERSNDPWMEVGQ
jgi:hypothetical protein